MRFLPEFVYFGPKNDGDAFLKSSKNELRRAILGHEEEDDEEEDEEEEAPAESSAAAASTEDNEGLDPAVLAALQIAEHELADAHAAKMATIEEMKIIETLIKQTEKKLRMQTRNSPKFQKELHVYNATNRCIQSRKPSSRAILRSRRLRAN